MKVYYKKVIGMGLAVSAGILLLLNLFLISLGEINAISLALVVLVGFSSFSYLTKPYFELRENELALFNVLGMVIKRYHFEKIGDFQVTNEKIFLDQNGKSVRVKLSKSLARPGGWKQFLSKISKK
jgi:hypothetical protein